MREIIKKNLYVIKKYYSNRVNLPSKIHFKSIKNEFREWIDDSFDGNLEVWTLPDLTRTERLDNFCRSIKKKIK